MGKKKGQNENRKQSRSPPRPEIKKIPASSKGDRSRKRDDESASPSRSPTQHRRDRKERPEKVDSGKVPSFGDRRDASRDSTSSSQKRSRTAETSSSRSKRPNSASSDETRRRKKSISPVSKKRKNGSDSPKE